jgi:hypothetical protein
VANTCSPERVPEIGDVLTHVDGLDLTSAEDGDRPAPREDARSTGWASCVVQTPHMARTFSPMILRFTDSDGNPWIAIWQSPVRFGVSTDRIPAPETAKTGIKFCNLATGVELFLEFSEDEMPTGDELQEMRENKLRQLLARVQEGSDPA